MSAKSLPFQKDLLILRVTNPHVNHRVIVWKTIDIN